MVLAKKFMEFLAKSEEPERQRGPRERRDALLSMEEAYVGFMALSACDPFVSSTQNATAALLGPRSR